MHPRPEKRAPASRRWRRPTSVPDRRWRPHCSTPVSPHTNASSSPKPRQSSGLRLPRNRRGRIPTTIARSFASRREIQRRAQTDFEEYLRLKPQAPDRAEVVARIETLRRRPPSATQALGLGLIVPGGGQFYTRRPIRGALFFAGAATAIGFAVQQQSSTKTVEETATDPFGNPYKFTTTHRVTDRPNLVPGIGIAAALIAGSALEAFMFAKQRSADVQRVSVSLSPSAGGVAARVSLQLR